ncbi:hypothetical protein Dimus_002409 [Dionaea muscipula]
MSTEVATRPSAAAAFIRPLASCHASERSKALKSLIAWLPSQENLTDEDMKKLWKSLFYCVWHCDKVPNQVHLIDRLSSLFLSLSPTLSLLYFSHFLLTMRREWPGIDRLRLDKFYLLIRVFIRHFFLLMKKENWDLGVLENYMRVLEQRVLYAAVEDKDLGYGVSYHIVSVFCQELMPFLPLRLDALNVLFDPLVHVLGRTDNKVLVSKVKSDVFDCLLRNGRGLLGAKKSGAEVVSKDEVVLLGTVAIVMRFSSRFYELGSAPDCVQGTRKALFDLHQTFLKLEKDVESSGIDIISFHENGGEDVPQLIPINESHPPKAKAKMDEDASDRPKKKSKKDKKVSKKEKLKRAIEASCDGDGGVDEPADGMNSIITFNETAISNLQKQFEKVAEEAGLDEDGTSSSLESPIPPPPQGNCKVAKKRKRAAAKTIDHQVNAEGDDGVGDDDDDDVPVSGEGSVKKVRFSMKSNLVWKPHTPLPPQSLRIPPSVTPRGSALKKGIPAGPVREITPERKKMKRKLKRGRKLATTASPAVKRLKKLITMSV